MKVRFGLVLTASVALVAGACASAGGGSSDDGVVEPRNDEYTTTATVNIQQAREAEEEGNDSIAEDRYQQALEAANNGIEADSMNPQAYYQAAFALVMLDRDYERADSLLAQATELYPDYEQQVNQVREQAWVNLYNQAIGPLNAGDTQEAIRLFEQANEMFDQRSEAYLNLGAAYARIGETEESAEAFRNALEAIRRRSDEVADMNPDSVRPEERESLEQNEQLAVQNLGRMLTEMGRNQEAIDVYSGYIDRNPDDIQALSNLAVALTQAEQADSAQAIYEDLLSRDNLSTQEYVTVGVGLYQAEQYEQAAEAFRRARDLNPRSRDAAYNLAQAYFSAEEWEEAVEAGRDVLELDPRNGNVYKLLARSLAEAGDQQAGGDLLEEYQELDFEVQGLQFQPSAQGGANVTGVLTNHGVGQGQPIALEFHFLTEDGDELGTQEQTVPAPAENESSRFEVVFNSEETPTGYWYEVVRP